MSLIWFYFPIYKYLKMHLTFNLTFDLDFRSFLLIHNTVISGRKKEILSSEFHVPLTEWEFSNSKLGDHLNHYKMTTKTFIHLIPWLKLTIIVWKVPNLTKTISRWDPNSVPKDAAARWKHWLNDIYHGSAVCNSPKI